MLQIVLSAADALAIILSVLSRLIVHLPSLQPQCLLIFLLAIFFLFFVDGLEQTLERLFDVDVLLGRGLAHKHKVIVLRKLLNLCNRHLAAPRVFSDQVDLVGDQRYLARLLAVLAQLRQPVVEALEALPIRQVEYQQGTHCLSIVSHDYGSIALTPTGVPDLC